MSAGRSNSHNRNQNLGVLPKQRSAPIFARHRHRLGAALAALLLTFAPIAVLADNSAVLQSRRFASQAIWLRLYPCDAAPGALDALFDRIAALGYDRIHLEVFYDGKVLLPATGNPTVWPSVLQGPDLLAAAVAAAHRRGMRLYAWLFALDYGRSYGRTPERFQALARNGSGRTSEAAAEAAITADTDLTTLELERVFADPYSQRARSDYRQMVEAILEREPDGLLFDYIRYPRGGGGASVAAQVKDLWIYGPASREALLARATHPKGRFLLERYLERGFLANEDIAAADRAFAGQSGPLWPGHVPQAGLPQQLWTLAVQHARTGIVDYLETIAAPALQRGIPVGAVFFPEANRAVGAGFDARLQPWPQFLGVSEWHPMVYNNCGQTECILPQVQQVLQQAPVGLPVIPVLAGVWRRPVSNHPPLEAQMAALGEAVPELNAVSHFAYSWQEPEADKARQGCFVPQ